MIQTDNSQDLMSILLLALDYYYGNIFITNARGKILYVNAASLDSIGCTSEELYALNSNDLARNNIVSESVSLLTIKTRKEQIKTITFPRTGKSSTVVCVPVFDEDNEIIMTVSFSQLDDKLEMLLKSMDKERKLAKEALSYIESKYFRENQIVAESQVTKNIFSYAKTVAASDIPIMISGESGTGKEVLAQFIHYNSNRTSGNLIPINCSAIPAELLESEFFGYVKGTFTGATSDGKAGIFEMADQGTLFLDEIGDFPIELQPKLLRVLETGKFSRLGSTKQISVNVRIISATNHDLSRLMEEGKFRKDLYYRLNVVPITLAPLRERPEDIIAFSQMFLERYNNKYHRDKYFSRGSLNMLSNYSWPGNIRELKNVVERLILTSVDNCIEIQEDYLDCKIENTDSKRYRGSLKEQIREFERERIKIILDECEGDIERTSRQLCISRSSLYQKLAGN